MLIQPLNGIIRFSLHQRVLVAAAALLLTALGGWQIARLPIDVFPDLDRPRVTVMVEAPGLAPEEVETLITFPLESVLNGATGVEAVRSSSSVGLAVLSVEFGWGTDLFRDRQIVAERLALAAERLPPGVQPQLAPISSVMGQILVVGLWSQDGTTPPMELRTLADWVVRQRLLTIPGVSQVFTMGGQRKQYQVLVDPAALLRYGVTLHEVREALEASNENATGGYLDEQGPYELLVRSLGRVQTREQIQEIVVKMREGRPVLVRQVARVIEGPQLKRGDSAAWVRDADGRFSGGPAVVLTVNKQPQADTRRVTEDVASALRELQPRLPGDVRVEPHLYQQQAFIDLAVENVAHALRDGGLLVVVILFLFLLNVRTTLITLTAIPLSLVVTALVFAGCGLSINTMTLGGLAVAIGELVDDAIVDVENIFRRLKENRLAAEPQPALRVVYQASTEVRNSIVFSTLIVVLVFTPVFALGGMEGRLFAPLAAAYIVSILSSLLVSLTVTPVLSYWLLAQRRAWPYVAALTAPLAAFAMAAWAAPSALAWCGLRAAAAGWTARPFWIHAATALAAAPLLWALMRWADRRSERDRDGLLLRGLQRLAAGAIGFSLRAPALVLIGAVAAVGVSIAALLRLESDFLPPFDEGAVQINVVLPPGTSLETSQRIARTVEQRLQQLPDIQTLVRRTGRAELDEHAVPVSSSEFIATLIPDSPRSRGQTLTAIREALADVPGIVTSVEQPLAHLISHMLSGVQAQIAVKLYGDDLETLRRTAHQMQAAIAGVPGVTDLQVEPQTEIPQLRIEIDGAQLQKYGLRRRDVNEFVQTAMNGAVVSEVLLGQRTFDLLVRLDEPYRENLDAVRRLTLNLPDGGATSLSAVANVYRASGPNTINREHVRRRIVVQCNTAGRGLVDVVRDIQDRLRPLEASLPTGYFVQYGGQFESQRSATRAIVVLLAVALSGVFLALHTMFRSANLSLQVMIALPAALIGAVAALHLTGQTLTVAALVGFISLCGIASRNGILLINHYLQLVRHEGESWTWEMIVRAGRERVAPVWMTALTSGIGLLPLAVAAGEPGKEILYPVATVILGGLVTSTLLEFFVRPALFWKFGLGAARRVVGTDDSQAARDAAGAPARTG
ncbi:MAG: efflux RND transporter permease subunit [Candidatus Anammoximicrobium sp.]|nr:efflux RND transporter permease subunit [Candidatus Anammoximicrobium sp.]